MAYEAIGLIEGRLTSAAGSQQQQKQLSSSHAGSAGSPPMGIDDFRERAQLAALLAHVRNGEQ